MKFAKTGSKFLRIPSNNPSKYCPRLFNCCKSGEISPNMVTLTVYLLSLYTLSHNLSHKSIIPFSHYLFSAISVFYLSLYFLFSLYVRLFVCLFVLTSCGLLLHARPPLHQSLCQGPWPCRHRHQGSRADAVRHIRPKPHLQSHRQAGECRQIRGRPA